MSNTDNSGLEIPTKSDMIQEKASEITKQAEDFWQEYHNIGKERGHEAKNAWYAKNKHRKPSTATKPLCSYPKKKH